jgi:trigger factor
VDVTINAISQTEQEAQITLSNDELQPLFEEAYRKFRTKAELKGFRKGKVPMEMIRKIYGEAIEQDALDGIATDVYHRAMDEKNIAPIGRPSMVDMDFQRGQHFIFKIKYEVRPPIDLKNYKGVAVDKVVHTVNDEELDAEIEHLRRSNSTTTVVPAATDDEHIVTGNVQELDETGTPLIGRKQSEARFLLSDTTLVKELRDALRNAETGGTYRATFSTEHSDHSHTMNVAITVTKVEKVALPSLDEALVAKLTGGKVTSTEEFKATLRTDLERYWNEQSERKLTNDIIDEVVRMHDIPVPQTMIDAFLETFLEDIKARSRTKDLPKDFDMNKFREENRPYAVHQAKWMLLKEQIATAEKISVTDEDIVALATAEAQRTGIDKERLLQYYRGSSGAAERILTDRVAALLRSTAKVTEKPDTK